MSLCAGCEHRMHHAGRAVAMLGGRSCTCRCVLDPAPPRRAARRLRGIRPIGTDPAQVPTADVVRAVMTLQREHGKLRAALHAIPVPREHQCTVSIDLLRDILSRIETLERAARGAPVVVAEDPIRPLRDVEAQHIVHAMRVCGGRRDVAAQALGIAVTTLGVKLKALGLTARQFRNAEHPQETTP